MESSAICKKSFLLQGFIGALLINFVLFCSIPGLVTLEGSRNDIESIHTVFLSRIKPEPFRPKPKKKPKPEEKKPEEIFKVIQPRQNMPKQNLKLELPVMDLNIDPRLADGVPVMAAPEPQPSLSLDGIMDAGQLDVIPAPSFKRHPRYPYRAKRMGIEGSVAIRFLVDEQGYVSNITVIKAEPPGIFEQAVLDAVSIWKYTPGELMGTKVKAWVTTTVIFQLEDE